MNILLEKRIQLMILFFRWTYKVANHPQPDSDLQELGRAFLYDRQRKGDRREHNPTTPHSLFPDKKNHIKKERAKKLSQTLHFNKTYKHIYGGISYKSTETLSFRSVLPSVRKRGKVEEEK